MGFSSCMVVHVEAFSKGQRLGKTPLARGAQLSSGILGTNAACLIFWGQLLGLTPFARGAELSRLFRNVAFNAYFCKDSEPRLVIHLRQQKLVHTNNNAP